MGSQENVPEPPAQPSDLHRSGGGDALPRSGCGRHLLRRRGERKRTAEQVRRSLLRGRESVFQLPVVCRTLHRREETLHSRVHQRLLQGVRLLPVQDPVRHHHAEDHPRRRLHLRGVLHDRSEAHSRGLLPLHVLRHSGLLHGDVHGSGHLRRPDGGRHRQHLHDHHLRLHDDLCRFAGEPSLHRQLARLVEILQHTEIWLHCSADQRVHWTELLPGRHIQPQLHRGGDSGETGCGLFLLGLLAEPPGSGHHDHLLPHHRLPQTALHQEVHLNRRLETLPLALHHSLIFLSARFSFFHSMSRNADESFVKLHFLLVIKTLIIYSLLTNVELLTRVTIFALERLEPHKYKNFIFINFYKIKY